MSLCVRRGVGSVDTPGDPEGTEAAQLMIISDQCVRAQSPARPHFQTDQGQSSWKRVLIQLVFLLILPCGCIFLNQKFWGFKITLDVFIKLRCRMLSESPRCHFDGNFTPWTHSYVGNNP